MAKQGIVIISSVIYHDGPRSKMEPRHDLHISHPALCDHGERGEIAIVIQKQMQFDSPLGSTKLRPVKEGNAEVNDRGIKTDRFVLKPEFLFGLDLAPSSFEQL